MQKIKLFKSIESELAQLETEINTWISQTAQSRFDERKYSAQTGGQSHMGTFSASDVLVVILYEVANA